MNMAAVGNGCGWLVGRAVRRTRVAKQERRPEIHETSIARQESHRRRSLAHIQAASKSYPAAKQESPSKSHAEPISPSKATKQESRPNAMHKQSLNLSRHARVTLAPKKISRPDSVHTQTIPDPLSKVSQQESPSKSHQARVNIRPHQRRSRAQTKPQMTANHQESVTKQASESHQAKVI